ncbi:hypothetical protein L1N85_16120 [Paenibacillus alkaliterrae]|uniref:hypothetical protein n=1 Tax=Paenibacillus alkaliterrae TaxID=320909 RepID=UPI001F2096B3|nr:hypothetical protein [Paenibacillus alkaliterrae]MCF2939944.1 hypothetical protein [Paenibacillus alkaliterrae]
MNEKWRKKNTRLIMIEDKLLAGIETCQLLMVTLKKFVKDSPDSLDAVIVRKSMFALHKIDKRLQDELLLTQLAMFEHQKHMKKRRLH